MRCSAAILALLAVAFVPYQTMADCDGEDDIVFELCADGNFDTLCDLLADTGINATLTETGSYFFLAPTDAAFERAGRRAGGTTAQKQATLQYHILDSEDALACGTYRDTMLFINGVNMQVQTRCTSDGVVGVEGNVRLPTPISDFPEFTSPISSDPDDQDDDVNVACNGKWIAIDNLLGFGPQVYDFGLPQPCSFYDPNCRRPKGAKGGVVVVQDEVDGVIFNNIYYGGKKGKKAKWANLNAWQSVYANNAYNVFNPYFGAPYYYGPGYYAPKKAKGYGHYGYGYGYGYGAKGGYWWRGRERNLRGNAPEGGSAYEPEEYDPSEYQRLYEKEIENEQ